MWVKINPQRRHLRVRKSAESQRVLDALYSYVEDNTNGPMKWLCSFWQDQQDSFGYEEVKQIVIDEVGPQAIFDRWFEDYSNFIREKMTPLWRQGIAAGAYSHPKIQELQAAGFTVSTSSANVNNWLLNRTGELVTNCTNTQIESIRYIIAEARSKGLSSDETARYIRPTIGLTRQQAGANLKLYESTKEQLRAAHPRMTDESIERKARDIAAKDAAKKQRTRAVTIARTENAYAYNYGNDEAIRQAEAAGLMPHMVPYWSTSHSGNVCPVCEELEGMAIDEGTGEFSVTWHNRDYTCELPPMHPRCMCAVEYREETEESSVSRPDNGEDTLGASSNTDVEESEHVVLGEVDYDMAETVISAMNEQIRDLEVEPAIVVDKDGGVHHYTGDVDGVNMTGVDFTGAWITHNHPESNGIVSFGEDDFIFLKGHQGIACLQCCNPENTYIIKPLQNLDDVVYSELYRSALIAHEEGEEVQDKAMQILAERGYIHYEKIAVK